MRIWPFRLLGREPPVPNQGPQRNLLTDRSATPSIRGAISARGEAEVVDRTLDNEMALALTFSKRAVLEGEPGGL